MPVPTDTNNLRYIRRATLLGFKLSFDIYLFPFRMLCRWLPLSLRPSLLVLDFAAGLIMRYQILGTSEDLQEAILTLRQQLSYQKKPQIYLNLILAFALYFRHREEGQDSDLEEVISTFRIEFEAETTGGQILRHFLGQALVDRFDRTGKSDDLEDAIAIFRESESKLISNVPSIRLISTVVLSFYPTCLRDLANALFKRYLRKRNRHDLDEAIKFAREAHSSSFAVNPFPMTMFDREFCLSILSNLLQIRFEETQKIDDLEEAIMLLRVALGTQPQSTPLYPTLLASLGQALLTECKHGDQDSATIDSAMSLFSEAMQSNSPSRIERFRIAKAWATEADLFKHQTTFRAYDLVLELLHKMAPLTLDVQARQEALSSISDGLARQAARYAIENERMDKAVEYLENGRAVFWSQVLQVRSPLDKVRNAGSRGRKLAERLAPIASGLERKSHRNILDIQNTETGLLRETETSSLVKMEKKWETIVNDIRQLKGFEDFLRPPRLSALLRASTESPVVLLVANDKGSHCLIIQSTPPNIHSIPLSNLSTDRLQKLVNQTQAAAMKMPRSEGEVSLISFPEGKRASRPVYYKVSETLDDIFKNILGILWDEAVKPVIDFLGFEKSNPSKLYWCPTGLFTFLPIHAAGRYNSRSETIECAFDYMISSYIPTLGSLLSLMDSPGLPVSSMMVVIQSETLPSTKPELKLIEKRVPSNVQLETIGLPGGTPAKVEVVASRLSNSSIVHFACHGIQDRSRPLESGLSLEDGRLKVARIMKEQIQQGSVAFLCACETAMGDAKIPDEAMNIGASLLHAGFQHVVATMWEMSDKDGPQVADSFYGELFRTTDGGSLPTTANSARALHVAVQDLRDKGVPFQRWVPFIHMGK